MQRIALWLTLLTGVTNGLRVVAYWQQRDVLLAYGTRIPIGLLMALTLFWTIVFLVLGGLGWRKGRAVWLPIPLAFLVYALYNVWLPTPTFPFVYWSLFLTFFTAFTVYFGRRKRGADSAE